MIIEEVNLEVAPDQDVGHTVEEDIKKINTIKGIDQDQTDEIIITTIKFWIILFISYRICIV